MPLFDQFKRDDPALRLVAFAVLTGLVVLGSGLWWVQVVQSRYYQSNLEAQSFRSIRVAAARGKILDRNGVSLAENRPSYDVCLYLEELRKPFTDEINSQIRAARDALRTQREAREKELGCKLTRSEARKYGLSTSQLLEIRKAARLKVVNAIIAQLSTKLQIPLQLDADQFIKHYVTTPYQPFPVLTDLSPVLVARFEEHFGGAMGVDLEMQSVRYYPNHTSAAHILGYVRPNNDSVEGEESYYSYRQPDFRGVLGVEWGYDEKLRGHAGGKSVLINVAGFRKSENVWQPPIAGANVVLTLDLRLQQAAEKALQERGGVNTQGAVVVMDVRNGDVLALVSSPGFNPNYWVRGFPKGEHDRMYDPELRPQINRATQDNYQPGSIFKAVVGMAALENGLNPEAQVHIQPDPANPVKGCMFVGNKKIRDTAPPGDYGFVRAFARSSNSYFIDCGLRPGVLERVLDLGRRLHLGERTGLPSRQETSGNYPTANHARSGWSAGDTANLSIGQARLDVTPLQMAVMISAIANNGTVFWPRIVQRFEPQDALSTEPARVVGAGRVRDHLGVSQKTLNVIHQAMLADTESSEGTGTAAAGVPGFRVGGKTGTAQIGNVGNEIVDKTTWFASYAPWESPRYAVVVMVESGSSGAACAPIARKIYEAVRKIEQPLQAAAH